MIHENKISQIIIEYTVGRAGFEPAKVKTNRFTVCPRWPLEYLPNSFFITILKNLIFCFYKQKNCFLEPMEGLEPTTC